MMQCEQYLNVGYQKILTFERPGGGFDWWGSGPALVWLSAYGVQQLTALSKVKDIDKGVIERAHGFLRGKQGGNGAWGVVGDTHGETIAQVENPSFALTAYVVWSLAEAGYKDDCALKGCNYIKQELQKAQGNPYLLSLAANALLAVDEKDAQGLDVLAQLEGMKKEKEDRAWWEPSGKTATCAYGNAANIETTAMITLAAMKAQRYPSTVSKSIKYIVDSKSGSGTWGSTQATILALKCLVEASLLATQGGNAAVKVALNGQEAGSWQIDDQNRDVLKMLDLQPYLKTGDNSLKLDVSGNPNVMYQVVTRYYIPWKRGEEKPKEIMDLTVEYDRVTLQQHDTIVATARLTYNAPKPTFMVIVDLGIPPGFIVDPGDFEEMKGEDAVVKRYSVTSSQVTLYLGNVVPSKAYAFKYHLKAKYPMKAQTPQSVAYEYYSPDVRGVAKPVEIEVK